MKYPKYGTWCKQNIIETIRKQKIHSSKKYLEEFVFSPNSDSYSTGVYDYDVCSILESINNELDNPSTSLFGAVQHEFAEKYFHMAQEMNPQTDILIIRRNDSENMDLLYRTLENDITIDELKDAVFYAFKYGTEEVKEPKIPYIKTATGNIAMVIKSDLTELKNVHIEYIDPNVERKDVSTDQFIEYLMHLNQSGIFSDIIKWRYIGDLFDNGDYLIEGDINHNNGYELIVAIRVINKEDRSKVAAMLRITED